VARGTGRREGVREIRREGVREIRREGVREIRREGAGGGGETSQKTSMRGKPDAARDGLPRLDSHLNPPSEELGGAGRLRHASRRMERVLFS